MKTENKMTNAEYAQLDPFLNAILLDYKNELITLDQAKGVLAHVFTALESQNIGEAVSWLKEGRKWVREEKTK